MSEAGRHNIRLAHVRREPEPSDDHLAEGGGPPHDGDMETRVSRLEGAIGRIDRRLADLPTKADLWSWKIQWTAISVGAIAMIVGGIIGGLAWIKPDPAPAPQIQVPPPSVIYIQPPALPAQPPAPPPPPAPNQ